MRAPMAAIAGGLLAAVLILVPAGVRAEEEQHVGTPGHTLAWNPQQVSALAKQLSDAVRTARQAARQAYRPGIQNAQEVSFYHFNDKLRLIANDARQLSKAVAAGRSQADVYPIYARMWTWIRDAQVAAKGLLITQDVQAKIDQARAILDQLDNYFD